MVSMPDNTVMWSPRPKSMAPFIYTETAQLIRCNYRHSIMVLSVVSHLLKRNEK